LQSCRSMLEAIGESEEDSETLPKKVSPTFRLALPCSPQEKARFTFASSLLPSTPLHSTTQLTSPSSHPYPDPFPLLLLRGRTGVQLLVVTRACVAVIACTLTVVVTEASSTADRAMPAATTNERRRGAVVRAAAADPCHGFDSDLLVEAVMLVGYALIYSQRCCSLGVCNKRPEGNGLNGWHGIEGDNTMTLASYRRGCACERAAPYLYLLF